MNKNYSRKKNKGRGSATRGWKYQKPNYNEKSIMKKKCGKKCFLGTKKKYPICIKKTCKISPLGVYSAYIRSRQYHNFKVSRKANKLLYKMDIKK
jgi:hypothetical protein